MRSRLHWILALACVLVGCSMVPTAGGFREEMNRYYGGPITAVVERFGPADREDRKPNGNTLYTWTRIDTAPAWFYQGQESHEITVPRYRVYGSSVEETRVPADPYGRSVYNANTVSAYCFFIVETTPERRVLGYEYWGNFCRLPGRS